MSSKKEQSPPPPTRTSLDQMADLLSSGLTFEQIDHGIDKDILGDGALKLDEINKLSLMSVAAVYGRGIQRTAKIMDALSKDLSLTGAALVTMEQNSKNDDSINFESKQRQKTEFENICTFIAKTKTVIDFHKHFVESQAKTLQEPLEVMENIRQSVCTFYFNYIHIFEIFNIVKRGIKGIQEG